MIFNDRAKLGHRWAGPQTTLQKNTGAITKITMDLNFFIMWPPYSPSHSLITCYNLTLKLLEMHREFL